MDKVRIAIIGFGNMGQAHAAYMHTMKGAVLGAICDHDPEKAAAAKAKHDVPVFATHAEMFASGTCDMVIVAVPHYDHVPVAIDAFKKSLHVLVEKPLAVSVKAGRELNAAYEQFRHLRFGIMFNQRTQPIYRKVRDLITTGELGEISRVTWIVTNWFRTHTYYASGGWRATWKGEGGGVLINQCPHNLDLMQWVTGGMVPDRVTAVGFVGKTHPIEVEDEMSAIFEYPNGAIGHFITSTGEAPGTNRLEICGDRGRLVAEHGKIRFTRTRTSVSEVNRTSPESFATIETWDIDVPVGPMREPEHQAVTQRFADVVREGRPNADLYAEGTEGIKGLEIGNAIMMSGLTRTPVTLPLNGDAYDAFINDMAKQYGGRKTLETRATSADMAASFSR